MIPKTSTVVEAITSGPTHNTNCGENDNKRDFSYRRNDKHDGFMTFPSPSPAVIPTQEGPAESKPP